MYIEHDNAICYSGYRAGQSPHDGTFPSYEEVRDDLTLLSRHWRYIRLYDCGLHAERVLSAISAEGLDIKVMLGLDLAAEVSNPHCPWGAEFSDEQLQTNRAANDEELERLLKLADTYGDSVFAASVGNEASVAWTDHLVSVERLIDFARVVRRNTSKPVTFCENYVPWADKLSPLVDELDFLSVHTYPVWEYRSIHDALEYTIQNYYSVADRYPDKRVIISEAGWTTVANGRGIEPHNASEELQATYYDQLMEWTNREKILTFVFEAFDEPWKGSGDPLEPEKHWGLFNVDRTPKLAVRSLHAASASMI